MAGSEQGIPKKGVPGILPEMETPGENVDVAGGGRAWISGKSERGRESEKNWR